MLVRLSGRFIDSNELQSLKAPYSMLVRLSGRFIEASELQPEKAYCPMLVILSGIVIDSNELPLKAYIPIRVTPSGMVIDSNELQPSKAEPPMPVRLSGRFIEANELQPSKADSPMLVRLLGNAISVRNLQLGNVMEVNLSLYLKSTDSTSLSEQYIVSRFLLYLKSAFYTDDDAKLLRFVKYSSPANEVALLHSIVVTAFASVMDTLPSLFTSKLS